MIRPSLSLCLDVEKALDAEAVKGPLTRSFLYVCPIAYRQGEADESVLHMNVRLPRAYWPGSGDAADGNWRSVMLPWLKDKLYKVGSVIVNYGEHVLEHADAPVRFGAVVVELKGASVRLNLDAGSKLVDDAAELVDRFRSLVADGTLAGVESVEIPARLPEAEAEGSAGEVPAAEGESAPDPESAAGEPAPDDAPAAPASEGSQGAVPAPEGAPAAEAAAPEGAPGTPPRRPELAEPDVWGVAVDGAVRLFDSRTCVFLED